MRTLLIASLLLVPLDASAGGRRDTTRTPPPAAAKRPAVKAPATGEPPRLLNTGKRLRWRGKIATRCRELTPRITKAAKRHGIDVGLVFAIIRIESGFKATARSRVGARGLMQVMPSSGRRLGCGDLDDPDINLSCGIRLLQGFLKHYDNNLIYGLSGYASGFARASAARRLGTLPSNLRYPETVLKARAQYLRHGCGQ